MEDYLWKDVRWKYPPKAEIDTVIYYPDGPTSLRYRFVFTMVGQRFELSDEAIEAPEPNYGETDVYLYYRYQSGHPVVNVRVTPEGQPDSEPRLERVRRGLRREDVAIDQSILSQRKDPDQYPEITYLGNQFGKFKLYREWDLGRNTEPRKPQKVDLPGDFLSDNANNLALVINDLQNRAETRELINKYLKKFYDSADTVTTRLYGGTVQLFVHERGLKEIPATRLSDGTLRYLCLLAVLCHPQPPPLICLEEPEIGLHPDILPTVAELLVEASQRTQLIVTTHSDTLVSALTHRAESVLTCDRQQGGSRLTRLDADRLRTWLEKYPLGELWRMGELGGTRW